MQNPIAAIHDLMRNGRQAVLARIIHQVGSAPRALGTECLFLDDGSLIGSIGGGSLEFRVSKKAGEIMEQGFSQTLNFRLAGEEVAQSEMLCGGIVDVYIEPVFPENTAAFKLFKRVADLLDKGGNATLVTVVQNGLHHADATGRLLIEADGSTTGSIGMLSEKECLQLVELHRGTTPVLLAAEGDRPPLFIETIKSYDTIYLFGAGHISTFVAPLARMVDFKVIVFDDREEFANRERFPDANDIVVCPLTAAFDNNTPTPSSYMVIITRGHIHDLGILRQVLDLKHAYIGMIGSRRKRDMIYQALRKEGVEQKRLDRVHSPIGLAIRAQTPEEIAVSIVAELILVRAARSNGLV